MFIIIFRYKFYEEFYHKHGGYEKGQIPFEKTPNYYDRPYIPSRILKMDKNTKVIIIFCDNVRRVLSRLGSTFPAQFDFSHLKT